ncbi:MAG: LytR C-terminal domain-containing protein [Gemmatimonadales bacterium]
MTARTVAALATILAAACGSDSAGDHAFPVPGDRGEAITVEVLNATGRAGLARGATRVLRRDGIDVVFYGNATGPRLDSTRILVRRGTVAVGEQVRRALGVGVVVTAPDTTLLLDASVLLGADFRSPLELHP